MTVVGRGLVLQAAILIMFASASARADGTNTSAFAKGDLQAKIRFCHDCHGSSGQGYRGVFPIPRLAGQTTTYIENQIQAFADGKRGDNIATILSKTHGLSPAMRTDLASHFAALNPNPIGGGPRQLVETGKKIYEEGIPEANVPACSLCHGQDAKGNDANARLAGQLFPYTVRELANWSKDHGSTGDSSSPMAAIAQGMTRPQIEAVAAYLSYLK